MAKAAFNNRKNLLTRKLDLNLRKKLVKCYIWSVALCGAATETGFVWCCNWDWLCVVLQLGLALCGAATGTGFVLC
jgi:hypothetical protein